MGDRAAKDALYAEFAAVGKVLANPKRLELLDLLAQGPRSVEDLAAESALPMSTCSTHLAALREAGIVARRRNGKRVVYSLAGVDVAGLWAHLRRVAGTHRPHTARASRAYLGPDDTDALGTDELVRRLDAGEVLALDVRPRSEFEAGHLPGALHVPLDELAARLADLPLDREIVAYCRGEYCVLAHDAVRLLAEHGLVARRAAEGVLEWRVGGRRLVAGAA